jgi:hypothetical protein
MAQQLDMVFGVYVCSEIIHAIIGFLVMALIVLTSLIVWIKLKVVTKFDSNSTLAFVFLYFQAGINAWQALEIVFLFLTTATLFIAVASIVCYQIRSSLHYYLAILAVFCVWPAGRKAFSI